MPRHLPVLLSSHLPSQNYHCLPPALALFPEVREILLPTYLFIVLFYSRQCLSLKLMIFLLLPPECWDYRRAPSCPARGIFLIWWFMNHFTAETLSIASHF
jgi:hypothetical protein